MCILKIPAGSRLSLKNRHYKVAPATHEKRILICILSLSSFHGLLAPLSIPRGAAAAAAFPLAEARTRARNSELSVLLKNLARRRVYNTRSYTPERRRICAGEGVAWRVWLDARWLIFAPRSYFFAAIRVVVYYAGVSL